MASIWGIVVVAIPPPVDGRKENYSYVVGYLQWVMLNLTALIERARNPSPPVTMLTVKIMMPATAIQYTL